MPFVPKKNREVLDSGGSPETVGDQCYQVYRELVREWKENPRWTTAHNLYKQTFGKSDAGAAKDLAWQIFLLWYVVPYEKEKEKENGTI
jgi:hypothetical protein